jgi:hypothetical protein
MQYFRTQESAVFELYLNGSPHRPQSRPFKIVSFLGVTAIQKFCEDHSSNVRDVWSRGRSLISTPGLRTGSRYLGLFRSDPVQPIAAFTRPSYSNRESLSPYSLSPPSLAAHSLPQPPQVESSSQAMTAHASLPVGRTKRRSGANPCYRTRSFSLGRRCSSNSPPR